MSASDWFALALIALSFFLYDRHRDLRTVISELTQHD